MFVLPVREHCAYKAQSDVICLVISVCHKLYHRLLFSLSPFIRLDPLMRHTIHFIDYVATFWLLRSLILVFGTGQLAGNKHASSSICCSGFTNIYATYKIHNEPQLKCSRHIPPSPFISPSHLLCSIWFQSRIKYRLRKW